MINIPILGDKTIEINGKQTGYKAVTFRELCTAINEMGALVSDDDIVIFSSLNPNSIKIDNGVIEFNNSYSNHPGD